MTPDKAQEVVEHRAKMTCGAGYTFFGDGDCPYCGATLEEPCWKICAPVADSFGHTSPEQDHAAFLADGGDKP